MLNYQSTNHQRSFVSQITEHFKYITKASAETQAGQMIETQIKLSSIIFWITDS